MDRMCVREDGLDSLWALLPCSSLVIPSWPAPWPTPYASNTLFLNISKVYIYFIIPKWPK